MRKISEIENVRGYYYITTCGKVISLAYNRVSIMKQEIIQIGDYLHSRICLKTNDNKKQHFSIPRLIAKAFIENIENKPEIDHIDRNPQNNSVCNLRWATRSENSQNRTFGWKTDNRKLKKPLNVYNSDKVLIDTVFYTDERAKYVKSSFNISRSIKRGVEYYKHNGYFFKLYERVETMGDECSPVG